MSESYQRDYDRSDAGSIFRFSRHLMNRTLAEAVLAIDPSISISEIDSAGKGAMGVLVEKFFYGYAPNSSPLPDFELAGLELKTTPLKKLRNDELVLKERLVMDMIDFCSIVDVEFEESPFYRKSLLTLILFYLHVAGNRKRDLTFLYSVLWQIKDKDLAIIRQDYELIVNKIRQGKAHELSEGDTMYLGACTKGHKDSPLRKQPFNTAGAKPRAFALKKAYMRTVLEFVRASGDCLATNSEEYSKLPELVSTDELKHKSFEQILSERFAPFIGLDYKQIGMHFGKVINAGMKNRYAYAAKMILNSRLKDFNDAEEIRKSGIIAKTIRISSTGTIKESMSFENIDYSEILSNSEWTESRWYEIVTSRFMFVIYRQVQSDSPDWQGEERYVLDRLMFWTMPQSDIDNAEDFWANIRQNVVRDRLTDDTNDFWKLSDHRDFHVRPKAMTKEHTCTSPVSGKAVPRKAYWFNGAYITELLKNAYGNEWQEKFGN